jgi:Uma2 family endonuclease
MGIEKTIQRYTVDEYLEMEEASEYRSEYFNGEIFAMSGGTANHDRIASQCDKLIGAALGSRDCETFTGNMKIRIPGDLIYYYPDLSVNCADDKFEDQKQTILKNPSVIIEVLSDSTESHDRGKKFHRYKQISSLEEYVLIAQDEYQIDVFQKSNDGTWNLRSYAGIGDVMELRSLGIQLKLADIYLRVKF